MPSIFQSYWRDEAFSVLLVQKPFLEIIRIAAQDFSPPLYFLVLKIWTALFGYSEVATRSLSFVFFILTLGTMYLLLTHITKIHRWILLCTVLILGFVHPLLTTNAFEARMYTMAAWLATLSWYFLLRKKWRWYALATLAGLYTHYFMILIVGTQAAYILVKNFPQRRTIAQLMKENLSSVVFFCVPILLFIPWVLLFFASHNFDGPTSFWIPKPTLTNLLTIPSTITFGHDSFAHFKFDMWPFSLLVYGILLITYFQKPKSTQIVFFPFIMWTFVPGVVVWVMSQLTTSLFWPRYLIVSTPGLVLLLVVCIFSLKPISKVVFFTLTLYLVASYMLTTTQFVKTGNIFISTKENLRSHIEKIKETAEPADYLAVESELDYHVAQVYWFSAEQVKIVGKTYEEIPDYVGKSMIPKTAILTQPYQEVQGYILKQDRSIEKLSP